MNATESEVLSEAAELVHAMTELARTYQTYVQSPELPVGGEETNLDARLRLSRDYDQLRPLATQRKLEMSGFDAAAAALDELRRTVFDVVGWLEMRWDDDESHVLSIDFETKSEQVLRELRSARESEFSTGDAVVLLTEAALMVDTLHSLGDDYQLCLEGNIPIPFDEDESDEDRMRHLASEFNQLDTDSITNRLGKETSEEAAQAFRDLSETVNRIVHINDDQGSDVSNVLAIDIHAKRDFAIDALKRARDSAGTLK